VKTHSISSIFKEALFPVSNFSMTCEEYMFTYYYSVRIYTIIFINTVNFIYPLDYF